MLRDLSDGRILAAAVLGAAALAASCGGENPAAPSAGVVVDGTVLGPSGSGALHARAGSVTAGDPVTVVCQEDASLVAIVSGDGHFTLRGLPAGGFTLQFRQGSRRLGAVSFQDVKANQEIVVTVLITGTSVELVDEHRSDDGGGDDADEADDGLACATGAKAEVEGVIAAKGPADITVSQTGKGLYLVEVPAGTPIRKGNKTYTFTDLAAGWRVHVKGQSMGLVAAGACRVRASEVKVQQD